MGIKKNWFNKRWAIISTSLLLLVSGATVILHPVSANTLSQPNHVRITKAVKANPNQLANHKIVKLNQPNYNHKVQTKNVNPQQKHVVNNKIPTKLHAPRPIVKYRHAYGGKSESSSSLSYYHHYRKPRYRRRGHYRRRYRRHYYRRPRRIRRHYYRRRARKHYRYRRRVGGRTKYLVANYNEGVYCIPNKYMNAIKHYRDGNLLSEDDDGNGFYTGEIFGYKSDYPTVHVIRSTKVGNLRFYQINSDKSELRKSWVLGRNLSNYRKYLKGGEPTTIDNGLNNYYAHHFMDHNLYNYYMKLKNVHDYILKYKDNAYASMPKYRQDVQVWVNYYKYCLYHENPVSLYGPYNDYAQQHDEAGKDPEDWTSQDNPSASVDGYFSDYGDVDHDGTAGHRDSLLNPSAIRLGVGRAHGDNTLFFDWGLDNNASYGKPIIVPYPNAGVFPYDDARYCEYWSFEFFENPYAQNGTPDVPNVSVKDDTANKYIKVSDVHTRPGAVYYNVNYKALQMYHTYTITLVGDSIPHGGAVSYTTCLVNL